MRVLNKVLPRNLHKQVIHAHYISHLMYGSPIWAGCLSVKNKRRLSVCLKKVLRLHMFDFDRSLTNSELYERSGIRSFASLTLINECKMLFKLVTNPSNFRLTTRLMSLTSFSVCFPDRPIFFDASKRKPGRNSFPNRAKRIN